MFHTKLYLDSLHAIDNGVCHLAYSSFSFIFPVLVPIAQCAGNGLTALKVVIIVLRSCVIRTKLLNLQQDSYQRTQHCASALKYTPSLGEVMKLTRVL